MRKLIGILLVISLLTFAFCGCNSESNGDSTTAPSQSANEAQAQPENMKMIIGKIENIAGNQVTLALADMSNIEMPSGMPEDMTFPEEMSMPEGMSRPEGGKPPEGFSMPDGEMPDFGGQPPEGMSMPDMEDFSMPEGTTMPEGGFGGFGGRGPQINVEDITYTGETEKYIIPTGVRIGSGDYTSLSKGMIISLQLDESNAVKGGSIISQ